MSARPRPVTATVTKPPWMLVPDADAVCYHHRSFSSGGSTESLTSILDHDSYISEPEPCDEKLSFKEHKERGELERGKNSTQPVKQKRKMVQQFGVKEQNNHNSTNNRYIKLNHFHSAEKDLSAWELWLIQKAQQERKQKTEALQQKKKQEQENAAKDKAKEQRQQRESELIQDWLERKCHQEKYDKKMQRLKIEQEKKEKEEREKTRQKAEENFAKWMEAKQKEEKNRKEKERELKQKEEEEDRRRKEKAEAEFKEWLKRHPNRPQSAVSPKAGKASYLVSFNYPKPSYVNPVPWQHPVIPKEKQEKSKKPKPKKYVWNPDKYF